VIDPNPAEHEADRHRDRDLENHHQYQSHRRVPFRAYAARLPEQRLPERFLRRLWQIRRA
jgi:hypothetical protein